jgi:hypothetical protein
MVVLAALLIGAVEGLEVIALKLDMGLVYMVVGAVAQLVLVVVQTFKLVLVVLA